MSWEIILLYFFSSNFICYLFVTAHIRIHQISHVIFGAKSQFVFKLCITLQCYETWLFCTFSSTSLYAMAKRIPSKCKFPDFRLLPWKLTKFLLSFFKPLVSLPLNFATPFSVVTHNSLKFSNWNIICFVQKEPINVQFSDFWVL